MKATMLARILLFLTAAMILAVLPGCLPAGSQPVAVEGQERDQILAKAEPIADNLYQAMLDHNFAAFSRDFDSGMKKSMDESRYNQMVQTLDAKIGKYQSRQVAKVEKVGTHIAVTYNVKYELENPVSWRVVFTSADPMQVSGLWYDSPKLRAK